MIERLKLIVCMVTGVAYISPRDSYACQKTCHMVGAKWNGAKWNCVKCYTINSIEETGHSEICKVCARP